MQLVNAEWEEDYKRVELRSLSYFQLWRSLEQRFREEFEASELEQSFD